MLKREGPRLLSIPRLISGLGLIYLLFVSFMILSVVASNLIPNGPILHAWFASAGLYITFAMVSSLLLTSWALNSSLFERTWSRP